VVGAALTLGDLRRESIRFQNAEDLVSSDRLDLGSKRGQLPHRRAMGSMLLTSQVAEEPKSKKIIVAMDRQLGSLAL